MPLTKAIKNKLLGLLQKSKAFLSLSKAEQKAMRKRLLALSEDKALDVIAVLEDEQIKTEALENDLKTYEDQLAALLPALKQASSHLQKAFIALQEKEDSRSTDEESQALLEELENV